MSTKSIQTIAIAIGTTHWTAGPRSDIGLVLATVAVFLARETKGLLLGKPTQSKIVSSICTIARAAWNRAFNGLFRSTLDRDQIVAAISADFTDTLSARDVEWIVATIEERVKKKHPQIVSLLIKPESVYAFERAHASLVDSQ